MARAPIENQQNPLGPARLSYAKHWYLWPLVFAVNMFSVMAWYFRRTVCLLWHHRWKAFRASSIGFWRAATLLSVLYLVYDRIFETDATLSASASAPKFAFEFPFTITNNSHLFSIRNVGWACQFGEIRWDQNKTHTSSYVYTGSFSSIAPGQTLNFDCSAVGPKSLLSITPEKVHVDEVEVKIWLSYNADLFGLFSLQRNPPPTIFTWFGDASNPQWIKSSFAKSFAEGRNPAHGSDH